MNKKSTSNYTLKTIPSMRNRSTEIVAFCQIVSNSLHQEEFKLYYVSLYYITYIIRLRFRKAGRVWRGGARETH